METVVSRADDEERTISRDTGLELELDFGLSPFTEGRCL
jgi:hypothetical protein